MAGQSRSASGPIWPSRVKATNTPCSAPTRPCTGQRIRDATGSWSAAETADGDARAGSAHATVALPPTDSHHIRQPPHLAHHPRQVHAVANLDGKAQRRVVALLAFHGHALDIAVFLGDGVGHAREHTTRIAAKHPDADVEQAVVG